MLPTESLKKMADNENMPWRCTVCNVPVRPGMNDPCDCTRADDLEATEQAWKDMIASREISS